MIYQLHSPKCLSTVKRLKWCLDFKKKNGAALSKSTSVASSITGIFCQGPGFNSGLGSLSVWSLHVLPRVCVGFLRVLRFPPKGVRDFLKSSKSRGIKKVVKSGIDQYRILESLQCGRRPFGPSGLHRQQSHPGPILVTQNIYPLLPWAAR